MSDSSSVIEMNLQKTKQPKKCHNISLRDEMLYLDEGIDSDKPFLTVADIHTDLLNRLAIREVARMLRTTRDPNELRDKLKSGEIGRGYRARMPSEIESAVLAALAARAKKADIPFDESESLSNFRSLSPKKKTSIFSSLEVARELAKIRGKNADDPLEF